MDRESAIQNLLAGRRMTCDKLPGVTYVERSTSTGCFQDQDGHQLHICGIASQVECWDFYVVPDLLHTYWRRSYVVNAMGEVIDGHPYLPSKELYDSIYLREDGAVGSETWESIEM